VLLSTLQLLEFGLGTTISRELARFSTGHEAARARDMCRTFEVIYFLVAICIGILIVMLAPLLAAGWLRVQMLPLDSVIAAVAQMGIAIALIWPCSLYSSGLVGLECQALQSVLNSALSTFRAMGTVAALLYWPPSIETFFLSQIVFGFVQLTVFAFYFWQVMPRADRIPRFRFDEIRRVSRFTIGIGATGIVTFVLSQMDRVILSSILSLVQFSYYSLASQINVASRTLPGAIFTAFFPRFSALVTEGDAEKLRRVYHQSCQLVSLVVFPAAMTGIFFAPQILRIWTGSPQIAIEAGATVSVLLAGSAINSVLGTPYNMTVAYGWVSFGFYQNLISAILLGPAIVVMAFKFGGLGAAIVWLILNLGYLVISAPIILSRLIPGALKSWFLIDVGRAVFVAGTVAMVFKLVTPEDLSTLLIIVFIGMSYVVATICCALVLPAVRSYLISSLELSLSPND
jgi:O-antigen/teichoic acid export membrane protein